jgi:hypothetical protein
MRRTIVLLLLFLLSLSIKSPGSIQYNTIDPFKNYYIKIEAEKKNHEFKLWATHLGYRESGYNYKAINSINCMGIWQFHPRTLIALGYEFVTPERFRQDPDIFPEQMQYEALQSLISANMRELIPYMNYIGDTINGIKITKAGLLAGMHLGGIGAVKLFLLSNGIEDEDDSNRTHISDYIKEFGKYEF